MAPRAARGRAGERGQALIEAMFVIPFVLVLILLILDFGIALDRREVMIHAVREGARAAANGDSVPDVKQAAWEQAKDNIALDDVSVCYLDGPDADTYPGDVNDAVRVTINHQYRMLIGGEILSSLGISTALDISPTAEVPLLNPVTGATPCRP